MIDDCNVNDLTKNHASAVFHLRAIHRSVFCVSLRLQPPLIIEAAVFAGYVCIRRRDTNMAAVTQQKHLNDDSVVEFCY